MRWFVFLVLVSANVAAASKKTAAKDIDQPPSELLDEDSVVHFKRLLRKGVSKASGLSDADIKSYLKGSNHTVPNIEDFLTKVQRRARRQRVRWRGALSAAAFWAPISLRNIRLREAAISPHNGRHAKDHLQSSGAESHTGRLHIESPARKQPVPSLEENLKGAPTEPPANETQPAQKYSKKNDGNIAIAVRSRQGQRSNKRRRHVRGRNGFTGPENAVLFRNFRANPDRWGYSSYRSDTSSSATAQALAILTQKMSKMELQLVRLKEVVLLQGAIHIRTSERMENMLKAQSSLASRDDEMNLEVLDRLDRCCTCSSADERSTAPAGGEAGAPLNGEWSAERTDGSAGRSEGGSSVKETVATVDDDSDDTDAEVSDNVTPLTGYDQTALPPTQTTHAEVEINVQNDRHSTANDRIAAEGTSPASTENDRQPERRTVTESVASPETTTPPDPQAPEKEGDPDLQTTPTEKQRWPEPLTESWTRLYEVAQTTAGAQDESIHASSTTPDYGEARREPPSTDVWLKVITTTTTTTTPKPTTTAHHASPDVTLRLPSSNGSITLEGGSDRGKTETLDTGLATPDVVGTKTAATAAATTTTTSTTTSATTTTTSTTTSATTTTSTTPTTTERVKLPETTWIPQTTTPRKENLTVDLSTGRIENDDLPGVSWVVPPAVPPRHGPAKLRMTRSSDTTPDLPPDKQCSMQGVLRFTFTAPPSRKRRHAHHHRGRRDSGGSESKDGAGGQDSGDAKPRRRLQLDMTFKNPKQWVFNLGDSIANNGFSGDGAVQENDCEVQGHGTTFAVYGSDKHHDWRQKLLRVISSFIYEKVTLIVSDRVLSWDNHRGTFDNLTHPSLFALSGQSDNQGDVNYDVFLGMNRVIGGNYRNGQGLCTLSARWLDD